MNMSTPKSSPPLPEQRIFTPFHLNGRTLRNRIVMPPMVTLRGITTPAGRAWYERRAAGGAALIIVEATRTPLFRSELTADSLRPLVDAVHRHGALIAIQVFPAPHRSDADVNTTAGSELRQIVEDCAWAARICRDAGFDGIEPHGAHGFFLNQFFSPVHNRRTDRYGGAFENRMRLALEICRAVKEAVGEDLLLLYRHTPVQSDAYTLDDSLEFGRRLTEVGVDVLDISPSTQSTAADLAAPFRSLGRPVIAVGRMDEPGRAESVLRAGRADLIAIGRGLIADPDWPRKMQEGREQDVIRCTGCNEKCFGNLRAGIPVACARRPDGDSPPPE